MSAPKGIHKLLLLQALALVVCVGMAAFVLVPRGARVQAVANAPASRNAVRSIGGGPLPSTEAPAAVSQETPRPSAIKPASRAAAPASPVAASEPETAPAPSAKPISARSAEGQPAATPAPAVAAANAPVSTGGNHGSSYYAGTGRNSLGDGTTQNANTPAAEDSPLYPAPLPQDPKAAFSDGTPPAPAEGYTEETFRARKMPRVSNPIWEGRPYDLPTIASQEIDAAYGRDVPNPILPSLNTATTTTTAVGAH